MVNPYRTISSRIKDYRESLDITQSELATRVANILRPEKVAAKELERFRVLYNFTQEEITLITNSVLDICNSVGMPTRMATSKVENGRRRLDFLEAMAICIALEIPPWAMLPEALQQMQPMLRMQKFWIFRQQQDDCYLFEHIYSDEKLLTLSITPQLRLKITEDKKHLDLGDVIAQNDWCEPLITPLIADPCLNPVPMDVTMTSSGEMLWTTLQ